MVPRNYQFLTVDSCQDLHFGQTEDICQYLHFAKTEDIWLKSASKSRAGRFMDLTESSKKAGYNSTC